MGGVDLEGAQRRQQEGGGGKFSDLSEKIFRFVREDFQICLGKFSDLSRKIFRFVGETFSDLSGKHFQICRGNIFRFVRETFSDFSGKHEVPGRSIRVPEGRGPKGLWLVRS